jgi:hypothetical protein
MTTSCPICGTHTDYIRVPIDEVWGICRAHRLRWRSDRRDPSWTEDFSGSGERAPDELGLTIESLWEQRTAALHGYAIAPEPNRHLVEIPDRFAVARWSRDADVGTIARCVLATLRFEPHVCDVSALRHALEGVIREHGQQNEGPAKMTTKHRPSKQPGGDETMSEMTPERQVIFDALVARVLALGMEEDEPRAVKRATVMTNGWSWTSENSDDGTGHLTVYDWVDPELCRLLDWLRDHGAKTQRSGHDLLAP